jgi:hypothetical protein
MSHPQLTLRLGRECAADLRRAAGARAAVQPAPGQRDADAQQIVILRMAYPDDARALAWLAELDEAPPLTGPVLIAEVNGSPTAAVSLSDLRTIANPYQPTAALGRLLMVRARQLQGTERSGRLRLARLRARVSS